MYPHSSGVHILMDSFFNLLLNFHVSAEQFSSELWYYLPSPKVNWSCLSGRKISHILTIHFSQVSFQFVFHYLLLCVTFKSLLTWLMWVSSVRISLQILHCYYCQIMLASWLFRVGPTGSRSQGSRSSLSSWQPMPREIKKKKVPHPLETNCRDLSFV